MNQLLGREEMIPSEKLLAFYRLEFIAEARSGFARLKRVPDSRVEESLGMYQSLSATDKASFIDCCAHFALARYSFVIPAQRPDVIALLAAGTPRALMAAHEEIEKDRFDHTKHPFFQRWGDVNVRFPFRSNRNVPMLRAAVSQYKIDRHRGLPSCVSEELFRFAESVKSIKAPELRKRVRATLNRFGYQQTDQFGGHRCVWEGQEFEVNVDFGGRNAQLRYSVTLSEFRPFHPLGEFCFEIALGMGFGHWNYIVGENVDDVFLLFEELIKYAVDLPRRMRAAT
jgi:hypothetical protein